MTDQIDYFEPIDVVPQEATLEDMLALAAESTQLAKEIAEEELATEKKRKRMEEINRSRLPEIMQSLGMAAFKLSDGSELIIEEKLNVSIPIVNRERAYAWIDDHGFGGIIKTELKSSFSRDERDQAEEARKLMAEAGYDVEVASSIHAATLKAWAKERLAAAADQKLNVDHGDFEDSEREPELPLDIFTVFEFKEAKIKPPKVSKKSAKK